MFWNRIMKLVSLLLSMCMVLSIISYRATTASADFEMTADKIVDDIVFGWNLGNTLDCYGTTELGLGSLATETSWGNPTTTKEMIDMVKDTGINAIRIPVTWYNHMDEDYTIDEAWLDRVEEIVNYVLDDDMYCIINVHHDTGEKGWLRASRTDLEENEVMFTAIWEQVAERFSDYGEKLLFESFNEILNDENEWYNPDDEALVVTNELNQLFVDTVRATGGNNANRCLIVNTYCAGGNSQVTRNFVLPTDTVSDRLIVEAHIYQPFYFTYESYPNMTTWTSSEIDSYMANMYNTFVANGIPVIIGEFGCVDKNNETERLSWAAYYVDKATSYGMKCFWWDNGTQYKIFNRRTLVCTEPDLLEAMLTEANGGDYVISTNVTGDADGDGTLTNADAAQLQQFLLGYDVEIQNCDLDENDVVNGMDLSLLRQMLLEQANLCDSEDNWFIWTDEASGGAGTLSYIEDGISVEVEDSGALVYSVQALYQNLSLEEGATYQISFDYCATEELTMQFNIMQNYGSYSSYFYDTLNYTTETQHYTNTFTMTASDNNTEVAFNLGATDIEPYTVEIRNLKLIQIA